MAALPHNISKSHRPGEYTGYGVSGSRWRIWRSNRSVSGKVGYGWTAQERETHAAKCRGTLSAISLAILGEA